jgi:hypothetical protein
MEGEDSCIQGESAAVVVALLLSVGCGFWRAALPKAPCTSGCERSTRVSSVPAHFSGSL